MAGVCLFDVVGIRTWAEEEDARNEGKVVPEKTGIEQFKGLANDHISYLVKEVSPETNEERMITLMSLTNNSARSLVYETIRFCMAMGIHDESKLFGEGLKQNPKAFKSANHAVCWYKEKYTYKDLNKGGSLRGNFDKDGEWLSLNSSLFDRDGVPLDFLKD